LRELGLPRVGREPIIADVSAATGFADQPHFTRVFKQQMGVTPKIYQAVFA